MANAEQTQLPDLWAVNDENEDNGGWHLDGIKVTVRVKTAAVL